MSNTNPDPVYTTFRRTGSRHLRTILRLDDHGLAGELSDRGLSVSQKVGGLDAVRTTLKWLLHEAQARKRKAVRDKIRAQAALAQARALVQAARVQAYGRPASADVTHLGSVTGASIESTGGGCSDAVSIELQRSEAAQALLKLAAAPVVFLDNSSILVKEKKGAIFRKNRIKAALALYIEQTQQPPAQSGR